MFVCNAPHKASKNDREALAQDLKAVYQAETEGEAKEALQRLRVRWEMVNSRAVARWETKAYVLLAFLRRPKPIRRYLYTTN